MIEEPVDARGKNEDQARVFRPSRLRRLFSGWSASVFQMLLGITQQVALVPVFLHFWTGDILAAWLVIYAVGNLVLIADAACSFVRSTGFSRFKSSADCDGRTGRFYAAMLRIYLGLGGVLAVLRAGRRRSLFRRPAVFGFQAVANFDAAFVVMAAGMLLTLPSGLVAGLYRARGLYGRAVWLQSWGTLVGQVAQLVAIVDDRKPAGRHHRLCRDAVVDRDLSSGDRCAAAVSVSARRERAGHSPSWIDRPVSQGHSVWVAGATELALLNLPVLLVSAFVSDRVAVAQWGLTRVVAGLLRALCVQTTLPLAAELGHDHAVGATERLRNLYARGSVFVALLASIVVSGLLPFWQDFFALWTHGAIPYDPRAGDDVADRHRRDRAGDPGAELCQLQQSRRSSGAHQGPATGRLPGLVAAADSADWGRSARRSPSWQAICSIQFGLLGVVIIRQTLQHPLRHVAVSGGGDDRDDAVRVGLGNGDPVVRCPGRAWHASSLNARYGWWSWRWSRARWRSDGFANRLIAAIPR